MEVGEAVGIIVDAGYASDKCPFCGDSPHDHPSNAGDETDKVKSVPAQLDCTMSGGKTDRRDDSGDKFAYTLAKHHLISAKQCYAKLKPLVRMGSTAGYDVNEPHNGIGLPTTHYTLKYPDQNGTKYGSLNDDQKKQVAYAIMEELGAQWHVGHHSFVYDLPFETQTDDAPADENWGDEDDDLISAGHETGYDTQIINKLIDLMFTLFNPDDSICKEEEDKSQEIQDKLKAISKEVKDDLEQFQTSSPWQSKLYVSQKARDYVDYMRKKKLKRSADDSVYNSAFSPPASNSKRRKVKTKK